MFQRPFLLIPVLLFSILFLLDKIFLWKPIQILLKSDFTYIYYEVKERLYEEIVSRYGNGKHPKNLMLVLGSSRLLYFDGEELAEFYPSWDIYNFSSAVTTPAYYYYYLTKIVKAGVKPDLLLLETDPNQFNLNSPGFKGSNLTYSFDLPFVLAHAHILGGDHTSFFLGKRLFAVSLNKPNPETFLRNYNHPNKATIDEMRVKTADFLLQNKGNAMSPIANYVEKDASILEATSQRTMAWLFSGYKISKTQIDFYTKILDLVQKENIPTLIVWPQSSPDMQRMMLSGPKVQDWKEKIFELTASRGYRVLDMDAEPTYHCNAFADGGHIAKDCYHPFMRYVFSEYQKLKK